MLPYLYRAVALVTALVAWPVLSGCSYEQGGSLNEYITDARIQRQDGDVDAALDLLREGIAEFPDSEALRFELAATLLAASPLSLFDLADAAEYVIEEPTQNIGVPADQSCAIPSTGVRGLEVFDPVGFPSFANIEASAVVLDSIGALITRTPDGDGFSTLERELRQVDLCRVVDRELAVLRPYGRDGILDALRADGLSDLQIGELLVTYAVSELTRNYYDLFTERIPSLNEGDNDVVTLYRVQEGNETYIGFCATNPFAFVAVTSTVRDPADAFLRATLAVELRAYLFGYPEATDELIIDAIEALISIQRELATCPE
ncbi:MAG: hypothetical protein AAF624_06895 [Bacteroidota bacterium]